MSEQPPRYELKYLCPGSQVSQVRLWMRLHPAGLRVAYPPRWVNSIYFDTRRLGCLADNLDGVAARSKLRLRWYGDDLARIRPSLEMKQKHGLLGTKALVVLDRDLDLMQPWQAIVSDVEACLPPRWRFRFRVACQPVLLNRYRREYYATPDGAVRVTLDSEQAAYDQRLAARPNLRAPLHVEDTLVLEIKADHNDVDRVQAVAGAFPVPRTRNSKYATGALAALYSQ